MKKAFLILALCLCANVCLAQTSIQGRSVDVRAFGAKCDNSTDDTTAIAAAITAVTATGGVVNLPDAKCFITQLTVPGGVALKGKGKFSSVLRSATNGVILDLVEGSGDFAFLGPKIQDLWVDGSDSGSSQVGIRATHATGFRDVVIENVTISDCGSHGLSLGNVFSSQFKNIYSTSNVGYNFFYLAPNMPANYFYGLYSGDINVATPAGFRIKQGDFTCWSCNGVNVIPAAPDVSYWAIVGGWAGDIDGDVSSFFASAKFTDCNIEGSRTAGIFSYPGSGATVDGISKFVGLGAASGAWVAMLFDTDASLTPENAKRWYIADTVVFANSPASFYTDSQPIRSDGVPPLQVQGRGPQIAGGGAAGMIGTYYNTTTSRAERLNRSDGYAPVIEITTTTSFLNPGGRAYRTNCAAPCTLTLPTPNFYENGNEVITIFNISATGTNVTIAANGGAGVNGSTYVMSIQGQSVQLIPDFTSLDWRVVGNRIGAMSTDVYPIGDSAHTITGTGSKISNSGSNLLFTGTTLYGTDNTINIGSSGDNRPANIYAATAVTAPKFFNVGGGACYNSGSASPEGAVTCEPGSIYLRTNGSWYIKSSGSGNTGWTLASISGTPTLTATQVGYGSGSNLLTSDANLTWTAASKILTLTSASDTYIDLTGVSTKSALRQSGGLHPGQGGGLVMPFIAGDIASGPGVWWCSNAYASCSGLFIKLGLNWQGASGHDNFKMRVGQTTATEGALRWDFQPTNSVFAETLSTSATGAAATLHTIDLVSTGTAAANFGYLESYTLENASAAQVLATSVTHAWAVATGGAEVGRFSVSTNNAGGGLGEAFTVEGDQNYGVAYSQGNISGAVTFDWRNGNTIYATLTGNVTSVTFSNIKSGAIYMLHLIQDSTGSRTFAVPASMLVDGGYTITATANARDLLICSAITTTLYCVKGQVQQ